MAIFDEFAKAYQHVIEGIASQRPSLLDWMLGGDYTAVMMQRNHLQDLYNSYKNG